MEVTKIVITGGPCGGKSTSINRVKEEMSKLGYTVLTVSETATELISGGIAPWTCRTRAEYQELQLRLQFEKEAVYEKAASHMDAEKLLIICDRGALDSRAYVTDEEFECILKKLGKTEDEIFSGYDAVFHLMSAATGAAEFYTTQNNAARVETVEESAELDKKVFEAWSKHPYHRVIQNESDFEAKVNQLIDEIKVFLTE